MWLEYPTILVESTSIFNYVDFNSLCYDKQLFTWVGVARSGYLPGQEEAR